MTYQDRVGSWVGECFPAAAQDDVTERTHRFLEEALELVQASGCTKEEARLMIDYVFDRPVGAQDQEVGGVMVTLDLSRICSAPLTWYFATKEKHHGTKTDPRIPR